MWGHSQGSGLRCEDAAETPQYGARAGAQMIDYEAITLWAAAEPLTGTPPLTYLAKGSGRIWNWAM